MAQHVLRGALARAAGPGADCGRYRAGGTGSQEHASASRTIFEAILGVDGLPPPWSSSLSDRKSAAGATIGNLTRPWRFGRKGPPVVFNNRATSTGMMTISSSLSRHRP